MFRVIEDLPDGVIGVEAAGDVTADDYRATLVPLIERAGAGGKKVRLLYVLGDDVGVTASGAWADTKLGVEHFRSFERIAVVTDKDWIENAVTALGWIIPGDVKTFDEDDREDAVSWLAES
jgi:SpoIIAA-like